MSRGLRGRLGQLRRPQEAGTGSAQKPAPGARSAAGTAAPAAARPDAPPPWLELTEDTLGSLPSSGYEVRLLVKDAGVVRALSRARGPEFSRVVVALTTWRAPTPGWRGMLGPVPGLVGLKVTWPATEKGRVTVALDFAEPVSVAAAARALLPLLMPVSKVPAYGSPEIVLDAATDDHALALLPEPAARQLAPEPDPEVLRGADVLLVDGPDAPATEVRITERAGGLVTVPTIDLFVHRPVGRRRPDPALAPSSASLAPGADGAWSVLGADGETIVTFAAGVPLRESQVRRLRPIDAIGLGALDPATPGLADRLVEIAATGPVLHGGGHLREALRNVDPALVALLEGAAPGDALDTTLRSVAQVRRVVQAHSGVAVRDALARRNGWASAFPSVTVLLTSRRTDAALRTLAMLGEQSYPHLDVVLAMHGQPAPDLGELDEAARSRVSHVIEADADELFGHVLARATAAATGVLVTKVDDDDAYGPEHVWDLVGAYLWSGAQVVGKQPEYVHLEGRAETVHRTFRTEAYVRQVAGGTILLSAADLMAVGGWRPVPRSVDRALLLRVLQAGGLLYATRGPGFVYTRHDRGHTWLADDETFLTRVIDRWDGLPSRLIGS
ncbi:MAG: hypothetical protein AAGC49_07190 [Brevundimonas sp.]